MSDKRADTIYMAKVQEQTERYDGMENLFIIFSRYVRFKFSEIPIS